LPEQGDDKVNDNPRAGAGNLQTVVFLAFIAAACYVIFQVVYPLYGFKCVEGAMEEWAEVAVHRSDRDPTEMLDKIRWLVDRYNIPLDPDSIQIEYDPDQKVLTVYARYDVYVSFPGYSHHYSFEPHAEAEAD
jgi:hypothetical protein